MIMSLDISTAHVIVHTVLLCHLKYGTTPSTRESAADWLNGTEVIQSYANCAGTVGVAEDVAFCATTEALTAAHGLAPYCL